MMALRRPAKVEPGWAGFLQDLPGWGRGLWGFQLLIVGRRGNKMLGYFRNDLHTGGTPRKELTISRQILKNLADPGSKVFGPVKRGLLGPEGPRTGRPKGAGYPGTRILVQPFRPISSMSSTTFTKPPRFSKRGTTRLSIAKRRPPRGCLISH
jgi:hypothetical protein